MKVYVIFKIQHNKNESIWTVCKDSKDASEWEHHIRNVMKLQARTEIHELQ